LKTAGVKSVEELFKKIHEEIRKNSDRVKRAAK
jgi:large subunit ribosomal protein L5e